MSVVILKVCEMERGVLEQQQAVPRRQNTGIWHRKRMGVDNTPHFSLSWEMSTFCTAYLVFPMTNWLLACLTISNPFIYLEKQSSNWFNLPLELHTPSKSTMFLGVIIQEELPPLSSWRQSSSSSSSSVSTRGLIGTGDIHQRQRRRWMERWPRLNHPENLNIWAFIQGRQQQSLLSQLWSNGSCVDIHSSCQWFLVLPLFIRLPWMVIPCCVVMCDSCILRHSWNGIFRRQLLCVSSFSLLHHHHHLHLFSSCLLPLISFTFSSSSILYSFFSHCCVLNWGGEAQKPVKSISPIFLHRLLETFFPSFFLIVFLLIILKW